MNGQGSGKYLPNLAKRRIRALAPLSEFVRSPPDFGERKPNVKCCPYSKGKVAKCRGDARKVGTYNHGYSVQCSRVNNYFVKCLTFDLSCIASTAPSPAEFKELRGIRKLGVNRTLQPDGALLFDQAQRRAHEIGE